MNKSVDRLKKHLLELAVAVNSFDSEAIQVKVISWIIKNFREVKSSEPEESIDYNEVTGNPPNSKDKEKKKPGLTKLIQKELQTGYFKIPRTVTLLTDYLSEKYESKFYTNQTSGLLLKLIKQGKLIRMKDESAGKFVYLQPE